MANIQDLFDIDIPEPVGSFIKTHRAEMHSHQVSFDEDVGPPAKYRDLINLLYMADENTEFNFFMNTSGGHMSSCMAIVEAMKATDARVRAIIVGDCHSAGSIIALNAHEVVVTDSALMMCHTANYGTAGSTQNVKAHTDFSTLYINKIIDNTYSGFLTPSEIVDLKKGVEMWLDSRQIIERLGARAEYDKLVAEGKTKVKKPVKKRQSKAVL
jgi:ATP-dependent protease ClpP protease subunit